MNTLRVLHFIVDLTDEGGAQRIVQDLVNACTECKSSILSMEPVDHKLIERLESCGIDVYSLKPFSIKSLLKARRLASEADVVHVHLFPTLYLGPLLPGPRVFTEHNTHNNRREMWWCRPIEKFIYSRYSRVVCISEATRQSLSVWLGGCGQARVVENGINLEMFSGAKKPLPKPPYTVGMVGSFTNQKDQATLVEALEKLPSNYRLRFVGGGPLRQQVEDRVNDLGLSPRVDFLGWMKHTEIPAVIKDLDIYVQSSHWEGFGLAPVEAMATGVPAFGTNVPGLSKVLDDPDMLFPVGDSDQLAVMIRNVVESSDYPQRSASAIALAQGYGRDSMARKYIEIWKELSSESG